MAICAGYAAQVVRAASWADTQQLNAIFPYYHWRVRLMPGASWLEFKSMLALINGLSISGVCALLFWKAARSRNAGWPKFTDGLRVWRNAWWDLTLIERRTALGVLVVLTGLRLVQSLPAVTPAYDDAPSYSLFVSRGILAATSYYPVPNNHVLSSVVDWLFFQVNPGFWWTMRLPVILAATFATILLFWGLLREGTAFRPALLAVLLFSFSQLSQYHAAVGRGYWLLTLAAGVVFFSTLALTRATGRTSRAAWLGLLGGGIVGAYAVPTFALLLWSAFAWIGWHYARRFDAGGLLRLLLAGLVIGSAALLLYSPLLEVSGFDKLFSNGFVVAQPWPQYLRGLPGYLWQAEGFLAGQMKVGAVLTLLVLLGTGWYRRLGSVPAHLETGGRQLIPVSLWFMLAPYAELVAQRVYAPERTLFYKSFFFFLLAALLVEVLLHKNTWPRLTRTALWLMLLGWTSYQFNSLARDNRAPRLRNANYHAAYEWLAGRTPAPTLVPEPAQAIFLRLYFSSESPGRRWQPDAEPQPGQAYTYVVAFPNRRGYFQPLMQSAPVFQNPDVAIYQLPAATPQPSRPAWWHLADSSH